MAKLKIPACLLVEALFGEVSATITGGTYDPATYTFLFDVQGADVPDVAEVEVIIARERKRSTFWPTE